MWGVVAAVLLLASLTRAAPFFRSTLTPVLVNRVRKELYWNQFLQRWRCTALSRLVDISAAMVCIDFFVAALPPLAWAGLHELAWLMVVFMATVIYVGDFVKVRA